MIVVGERRFAADAAGETRYHITVDSAFLAGRCQASHLYVTISVDDHRVLDHIAVVVKMHLDANPHTSAPVFR